MDFLLVERRKEKYGIIRADGEYTLMRTHGWEGKAVVTAGKELTTTMGHRLTLEGREMLMVTGVTDAVSFDELAAVLETARGTLVIRGAELHVEKLNLEAGEVKLSGRVDSLAYEENNQTQGGFLQRLFR